LIEQEIENARRGGTGHIIAKLNALTEPEIILALYRASCAGVMVDLVVRGVCCLRPGMPGVSENIRVKSIIGRFLEHSRVYYFHSNGQEKVYCSSADWMDRNVFRRVEVCFPIADGDMKKRLLADLDLCIQDNAGSWELQSDCSWRRDNAHPGEDSISVQRQLLQALAEWG
jgi:polyphosphate kinase